MKIDGREIAQKIFEELREKVRKLKEKNIIPTLAIILVGDDPPSKAYVRQKDLRAKEIGAETTIKYLLLNVLTDELLEIIEQFNKDKNIHGIIVQQPLPAHINVQDVTQAIDPQKDVDGFNLNSKFQPPISMAVLKILEKTYGHLPGEQKRHLKNTKIVIAGKGKTGGKLIAQAFKKLGIEPIVVDSKTKNPQNLTKTADIIISAVGKSNVIKPDMIKKGVTLIGIGLHKEVDGKLHGDYEEEEIKNIASFYTPTPGGVGPVNVAMLLKNLVTAAENLR